MEIQLEKVLELFSDNCELIHGKKDLKITGFQSATKADVNDMVFISEKAHLKLAQDSDSKLWAMDKNLYESLHPTDFKISEINALLVSKNIPLFMAKVLSTFLTKSSEALGYGEEKIHSTAVISQTASLGNNVVIGPFAFIGENCKIGNNVFIGGHTHIQSSCEIGDNSRLHPHVFVGHHTRIGQHCEIQPQTSLATEGFGYATDAQGCHHRIPHQGFLRIEDHVDIGAGVQVDRATFDETVIGEGTKIDNHCHIAHNVKIGKHNVITGGFIIAGSSQIGSHCVFGGRALISGHLKITDKVVLGGLSTVTKNIEVPGKYAGYPLLPLNKNLKTVQTLTQLVDMRKNLHRIMKKLGIKESK